MSVTFRSPVWQWSQEASKGPGQARILAFPSAQHGPEPIMRVVARQAFWSLGKATLLTFARHVGAQVCKGSSLFDTVFALVQCQLPELADQEVFTVFCRRVAGMKAQQMWSSELAQVDEATEVLDQSDEKAMAEGREQQQSIAHEMESFTKEYAIKAAAVRAAAAKARKGSKAAAACTSKSAGKEVQRYPRGLPSWPDHSIDMKEARTLLPVGASLWRDVRFGNFQELGKDHI